MVPSLDGRFPRYTRFDPPVPVYCVTPHTGRVIHRFFDTSPFSPSGRYMALCRLPYEDRLPVPGDTAEVVLVDLAAGTERVVAATHAWDNQLGAQVQWGGDDTQLIFNDMDTTTWRTFAIVMDPATGRRRVMAGTAYMATRDGRFLASPCLRRTARCQAGYGVVVPPEHVPLNRGAADDDGVYVTDTTTGTSRLLVSFKTIVAKARPELTPVEYPGGVFYGFHVKWNVQGTRLMLVLRWFNDDGSVLKGNVITMRADGTDIRVAIPAREWTKGGHHPDWCPDGDRVMMNLKLDGTTLRFVSARYDGKGLASMTDAVDGSGHPTLHPDGRHVVTDAYLNERCAFKDGTVPIRWVDIAAGTDITAVRINRAPAFQGPKGELRVDPHPAWDRDYRWVAFNGSPDGTRRVYVADMAGLLKV